MHFKLFTIFICFICNTNVAQLFNGSNFGTNFALNYDTNNNEKRNLNGKTVSTYTTSQTINKQQALNTPYNVEIQTYRTRKADNAVNLKITTVYPNIILPRKLRQVNAVEKFPLVDLINTFPNSEIQTNSTSFKLQHNYTNFKAKAMNATYPKKLLQNYLLGVKTYNSPAIHRYNLYKSQFDIDEVLQVKKPFYQRNLFISIAIITSVFVMSLAAGTLVYFKMKKVSMLDTKL